MKKLLAILITISVALSFAACSCVNYASKSERSNIPADEIKLVKDESYYDDFEIDDSRNVVNFKCSLTFKNTSENTVRFYLVGDFKESQEIRLITDRYLRGVNFEDKNERLTLEGNEKKTFTYIFKGEHDKAKRNANRSLPEIKIYKIK